MTIVIIGILFMGVGTVVVAQSQSTTLSQKETAQLQKITSQSPSNPMRVYSYSANINSVITQGGHNNNKWILSDTSVLYLPTSNKPAEGGNTVLYAHNRKNLFGNLKYLKKGDYVIVENEANDTFVYRVYEKEEIKPSQTEKINTNISDTLTLFTCDGAFDQKRLVIKAKLVQSIQGTTHKSSPTKV